MDDLRIRPVEPGDLAGIVRLCAAHAAYEGAEYDPSNKARELRKLLFVSPARLFCRVVEIGTAVPPRLAGYVTWAEEVSTWHAAAYLHMDCLYLEPEVRGAGIGRRLVAGLARDGVARGHKLLQWQTPGANVDAIRFYDRLGASGKHKVRFYLAAEAIQGLLADA